AENPKQIRFACVYDLTFRVIFEIVPFWHKRAAPHVLCRMVFFLPIKEVKARLRSHVDARWIDDRFAPIRPSERRRPMWMNDADIAASESPRRLVRMLCRAFTRPGVSPVRFGGKGGSP
ncbi:MAG: hypothetical protein M1457_03385, partial [bacterium]|nr:hypothetical protein [bacterium]